MSGKRKWSSGQVVRRERRENKREGLRDRGRKGESGEAEAMSDER